jgi:hypothetical protein
MFVVSIVMLTFRDDPKSYFTSSRTALGRQNGCGKLCVLLQALLTTTLPPLQLGLHNLPPVQRLPTY